MQRMLAEASYKQKFAAEFVIISLVLLSVMKFGESKVIFNELVPDNSSCPQSGDHGCLCNGHSACNETKHFECIDSRCVCKFPLRRTYEESLGKCMALVGSPCSSTDRWALTPECVRNAECEIGRCFCRGGYSKTSDNKMCKISHGEECGPWQCNEDRGLACKEGTCQCADSSYVYSAIHTECIDPEAVIRDFIERATERIFKGIFNYKVRRIMRKLTMPLRAMRPLGWK